MVHPKASENFALKMVDHSKACLSKDGMKAMVRWPLKMATSCLLIGIKISDFIKDMWRCYTQTATNIKEIGNLTSLKGMARWLIKTERSIKASGIMDKNKDKESTSTPTVPKSKENSVIMSQKKHALSPAQTERPSKLTSNRREIPKIICNWK